MNRLAAQHVRITEGLLGDIGRANRRIERECAEVALYHKANAPLARDCGRSAVVIAAAGCRQQNWNRYLERLHCFRRLGFAGKRNGQKAAGEGGVETLVTRPVAFTVEGALGNFERIIVIALRQHDGNARQSTADGLATRRFPLDGPDVDLVVELAGFVVSSLKIENLSEEHLGADYLR